MAQPLPYGYTWASEGGQVTGGIRPLTDAEWQAGRGAGSPSAAPNQISAPPPMLGGGGAGDGGNMYQDDQGVHRNRRPSAGTPAIPQPPRNVYAPTYPGAVPAGGGGGAPAGGGNAGGGATGTMGGGGRMATTQNVGGGIRTQFASLDPSAWGQDPTSLIQQSGVSAGNASNVAGQLAGVNPQVGQMDRTLYDKYQSLLMDPSSIQNDQNFGFQLDRAQEAARRQLAAGRGRHSGRALEELAGVTIGNIGSQFGNLASIYGQGAGAEQSRWSAQTGAGLQAADINARALQGAGNLYLGAGDLSRQSAGTVNQRAALDLQRVQAGIASPQEEYQQTQANVAANNARGAAWRPDAPWLTMGGAQTNPFQQQVAPSTYASWVQSNWGQ